MPEKIDWSLKKVLVKEDLDLSNHSGDSFLAWRRQFNNFLRESGADRAQIAWEAKWAALESCMCSTTFKKVEALRMQLPVDERENMARILQALTEIAGASDNVWIHRHKFNKFCQKENQTFKQFYSELITLAGLCRFDENICAEDKQKVIDLFLLNKIVFDIKDNAAKKKLLEEKELTLVKAINLVETYEEVQKAEETISFAPTVCSAKNPKRNDKSAKLGYSSKKQFAKTKSEFSQIICTKCGYTHRFQQTCPARDKKCNYCDVIGHFEKVCYKKARNANNAAKYHAMKTSGAIVASMETKTEMVNIHVHTDLGGDRVVKFMIDTGSDWTVVGFKDLNLFGIHEQNLKKPTKEMKATITATSQTMVPRGYVDAVLKYGGKETSSKLVVFENVQTPLLGINVLKTLGIVQINTDSENLLEAHANQVVVPFGVGKVFLSSHVTRCDKDVVAKDEKTLIKQQLLNQ